MSDKCIGLAVNKRLRPAKRDYGAKNTVNPVGIEPYSLSSNLFFTTLALYQRFNSVPILPAL